MLSDSIKDKLNAIKVEKNRNNRNIYKKYGEEDMRDLEGWLALTGLETPSCYYSDYLELLSIANGLNFNGLFVYSIHRDDTDNIYDSNAELWENDDNRRFIFFADDCISWYCLNVLDMKYYVLDKPSGTIIKKSPSFNDVMEVALESALS